MGDVFGKKHGENHAHDQELKQRGKDAPEHAQHGSLIFQFEVPLGQLCKEEPVLFQIMFPFLNDPFQLQQYGLPLPNQMI